jgi:protoporphyrin/coproporphyrin ferrochelatase
MTKIAVVLFNLGGPDSAGAVEPFLFNLFYDPAIITLPNPFRFLLSKFIAKRRGPVARAIYAKIGNASPLLPNTVMQAQALEKVLGAETRVFVAMRYWSPRADETVAAVKAWGAEKVILLPLYPQFSTTTTASSVTDWHRAATAAKLAAPTQVICCYPTESGFVEALASNAKVALANWQQDESGPPRILFSAHGLPKRIVERGDPYQAQVEQTAAALRAAIARPDLDMIVCYQSRVGRLEWLGPATDAEIRRAGNERKGLIVVPIAFVSEHSETLVELDIEYRHVADAAGVPRYVRVPTVGVAPSFIAGLAGLVRGVTQSSRAVPWAEGGRSHCPEICVRCAQRQAA